MKIVRLIPVLLLALQLTSCNTTKQLYEAQEYDQVIQRLAPDICGGDQNAKRINMVAASYHKANQADHERIQALKATGQPDVWPEIYQRYLSMKGRNDALRCFPTKVKNGMNYRKLDLDDDITVARNKAEAFLAAKSRQLLETGSKADALEAESYISQLQRTNRENPHLLELQKKAAMRTADRLEFSLVSQLDLPAGFQETVFAFDENELPAGMAEVCVVKNPLYPFVNVVVEQLTVTPIRLDEVTFKEENQGKTVTVTDHSQNKTAKVKGYLRYRNKDVVLGDVPFEVTSTFKNDYTTIKGDREACSAETFSRLDSHPVPVPTDESLLLDAAKKLNDLIAAELRK